MIIYKYYKFPTQGDIPNEDEWPKGVTVDVIGQMIKQQGSYDSMGNEITPPIFEDGWFVNVSLDESLWRDLSFVDHFEINVKTPNRIWFGQTM